MSTSDVLPTVDFSAFTSNEGCMAGEAPTEKQREVAAQIDSIMQEHGFLYLENFGVSDEEVAAVFHAGNELFNAGSLAPFSMEENMGHTAFGEENLNHRRPKDLRESFTMKSPHVFKNDFSGAPDSFEPAARRLWEKLEVASRQVLTACALALGLPNHELDFFVRSHKRMDNSVMRINHYPPCSFIEGITDGSGGSGSVRIGEHADFGVLTFLFLEEGSAGLQVCKAGKGSATAVAAGNAPSRDEAWIEAPGRGGACAIVNSGAALARWTNDRWQATVHRVVVPSAEEATRHRYSIPFFVQPDQSAMIETHPLFIRDGEVSRYEPISAQEHLMMLVKSMQLEQQSPGAKAGA